MPEAIAIKPEVAAQKANEEKWTKPLMDAGWTAIPSVILEKQHALGLDAIDMNIISHLTIYWWKKGNLPHPSVATIAKAIGVKPRTVQKHIKAMEALGFITRHQRRREGLSNATNLYSFEGLIKAATPYAIEKNAAKAEGAKKEGERVASKKPKLTVVP
jgi:DNA-binding transcriptional regulator YhcF (GntR family)